MASKPILLVLGAGPNIGIHVSKFFAGRGYKVALASRSKPSFDGGQELHIPVDLSNPENVPGVFEAVRAKFGESPSVVVYNCASHVDDNMHDPLSSFSLSEYVKHQNINTNSVLVVLQEAVSGFRSLSDPDAAKTFIYTGNILNVITIPGRLTFGLGKSGTAYAIRTLVEGNVYSEEGICFYYTDERTVDGLPVYSEIDGETAAEEYFRLAEMREQGPWLFNYVKGLGFRSFEGMEDVIRSTVISGRNLAANSSA
ncbi:uncharacterized protein A1O9_01583 [Exophiala aquamarina CBS 119918]|uniref:Uncharacterized protein n=1 Tax=Exophiala aquamarina CBS 119918 TaxID=1182545 RepID=A0A072Q6P6_9EURO|nr:uncharacterized protein A1O9_01583 [Exophiala aquamarina CBS 119918]KEF63605.1 hypothetical protein A1O9_01583 [Exophiala aquamarina CBS 119918]